MRTRDFAAATEQFSASRDPFDLWFKDELLQATGIDLNVPPELSLPELLSPTAQRTATAPPLAGIASKIERFLLPVAIAGRARHGRRRAMSL